MRSTLEWRYWGKTDPLYAVATWKGRDASGEKSWTPEEFFRLGRQDFSDVLHHWDHYGRISGGTCIEIGCGSGRMTAGLLTAFDRVFAIDVSVEQLETARRLLAAEASRVQFDQVDTPVIRVPNLSCTGMFTTHVFQHFSDYAGIVAYLRETFRALAVGGTICFHLPVPGAHESQPASPLREWLRHVRIRTRRRFGARALMEYHRYPVARVFDTLAELGYRDTELRIFPMSSNGDPHSFFFARKR